MQALFTSSDEMLQRFGHNAEKTDADYANEKKKQGRKRQKK